MNFEFPREAGAVQSGDGRYRYLDTVHLPGLPEEKNCCVILARPDKEGSSKSVKAAAALASGLGCGRLLCCYLFAYRAADTADFLSEGDPIGDETDLWIARAATASSDLIVAAWGAAGSLMERDITVLGHLSALGLTASSRGTDRHGFPYAPPKWAGDLTPYTGRDFQP